MAGLPDVPGRRNCLGKSLPRNAGRRAGGPPGGARCLDALQLRCGRRLQLIGGGDDEPGAARAARPSGHRAAWLERNSRPEPGAVAARLRRSDSLVVHASRCGAPPAWRAATGRRPPHRISLRPGPRSRVRRPRRDSSVTVMACGRGAQNRGAFCQHGARPPARRNPTRSPWRAGRAGTPARGCPASPPRPSCPHSHPHPAIRPRQPDENSPAHAVTQTRRPEGTGTRDMDHPGAARDCLWTVARGHHQGAPGERRQLTGGQGAPADAESAGDGEVGAMLAPGVALWLCWRRMHGSCSTKWTCPVQAGPVTDIHPRTRVLHVQESSRSILGHVLNNSPDNSHQPRCQVGSDCLRPGRLQQSSQSISGWEEECDAL